MSGGLLLSIHDVVYIQRCNRCYQCALNSTVHMFTNTRLSNILVNKHNRLYLKSNNFKSLTQLPRINAQVYNTVSYNHTASQISKQHKQHYTTIAIQQQTQLTMSLQKLKSVLQQHNLTGYIVPTADAHQSEYVAECDARRAYITGFTGSAGTALILNTSQKSLLWTDGRYFIQADNQLNKSEWELQKQGIEGVLKLDEWIVTNLPAGSRIGVDPTTITVQQYKTYTDTFSDKIELVLLEQNLVDSVWSERPSVPLNKVFVHPLKYSGETTQSKVSKLRSQLKQYNCQALVVTMLDEICWLFNLRGSDIDYNPVFFAYGIVTADTIVLYINEQKLTSEVQTELKQSSVTVKPYNQIFSDINSMKLSKDSKLWLDISRSNVSIYKSVTDITYLHTENNPIALLKGIKNKTELDGMRAAHIRDGAAECNFLCWLEQNISNGKHTEVSIADKLAEYRSKQSDFVGLSFDTIAGSGPNGAIIHYRAEPDTCRPVGTKEVILLDSGAQYKDGTTDITRTFHLGQPTEWEKRTFTLVLKGYISIAQAVFPNTVAGPSIDAFARQYLWNEGLDYMHGTGHGVGAFLNVHEGPHGISSSLRSETVNKTQLQPGMIISNEPGYYEQNNFGIRIESLIITKDVPTKKQFNGKSFLGFETITMVPIQQKMIDTSLLTQSEIEYLNAYHNDVRSKLENLVDSDTKQWLIENTKPIQAVKN